MPKYLINGLIFALVVAAFWLTQDKKHGEIVKSPNDQREYKAITLDNDLTVMLVSDPTADKAAAAMDVSVGSSDDPKEFLGLAHFLEHMLFLGTEKYPNADEYQKFISDHGGGHNAFTSLEHTNYFFDINADYLEGALDRFSQQFTSPLFNEEYVVREVNAVHSEYSSKIKDDSRRYFSVVKEVLADGHPYGQFSVGNLETLKDKPEQSVREALLDFYQKHYSANQMKLVVLGKEPLTQLEEWVRTKFSDIPNKDLDDTPIKQPFFDDNFLPAKVSIQSIMDKRSLGIGFPVPSAFEHHYSQPIGYLSNLIGHEGKGSLLSYLKQEGLVDSLGAGKHFDTKEHAIMSITMGLTQKGLENQALILEALFAYIEMLKESGIQKLYFDEQAAMLGISFNFQEKSKAIHYVSGLAGALQDIEPEKVLVESYMLKHFDADLYRDYLEQLTPQNMLVTLSSKAVEGDKKSAWYETSYKVEALDESLLNRLSSPPKIADMSLPEKNIFIPENVEFVVDSTSTKPELLVDKEGIELWYAPDVEFGTPKANLFVTIRSPISNQTARNLNLTELMVSLIKDDLNEFSYPAYLAGLNYELYNHIRGITIKISGYSDKQTVLLNKLLEGLKQGNFSEERFEIYKERMMRGLNNAKKKKPYEQAIAATQRILLTPSWTDEERLAELETTTIEDIGEFHKAFFQQLDLAVLSTGNVTADESKQTLDTIEKSLLADAERLPVERGQVTQLSGDQNWYKEVEVTHPDTGFVFYLQGRDKSFEERARFMLLSQIISTDYYAKIRTEKQLGYIVFATNFSLLEQPALAFIVQSPTASGPTLLHETNSFLQQYAGRIEALNEEELARYQKSVISRLQEQDTNLYKRSNRNWREIDEENFHFDSREKLIASVAALNREDIMTFYRDLLDSRGNGLLTFTVNEVMKGHTPEGLNDIDTK